MPLQATRENLRATQIMVQKTEAIRLLTNLETTKHKLLQIFLIGHPELRTILKWAGLDQQGEPMVAYRKWVLGAVFAIATMSSSAQTGWYWQNPRPHGNELYSVFHLSPDTAWTVGPFGTVLRTDDGGATA